MFLQCSTVFEHHPIIQQSNNHNKVLRSIKCKMKLFCLRLKAAYFREKGKLNILLKFQPNRDIRFWDTAVERFFEFYCLCQYIDKVNEENWQNMLININFWQYFTNILWINLHTTFILQDLGLKLCQSVPIAQKIKSKLTGHANLHN